jgi:predicted signal transduction protein with EAL and GGDEF domain
MLAGRLRACLRSSDTAARFGGDEFVVLCEDVDGEPDAVSVAERLAQALDGPFAVAGDEVYVHASIGIALTTAPHTRPEALVRDADAAMYRAKERGGSGYEVFDPDMRDRVLRRMSIEHALHRAIERDELRVHYQPLVSIAHGDVVGVEALVRWEHPERGLLGPFEFIPTAEETGLIHDLGAWVLAESCRQSAAWAAAGRRLRMSVNLSARQCHHPDLAGLVAATLAETGADPELLCLEVTETAVMDDLDTMAGVLSQLRALGITLAIDDFGTGYSSLRALQMLPVDVVKIDRSFISEIDTNEEDAAIAAAVIGLAHALGLSAVGEGIETVEQLDRLRLLGCDVGQGYLFSRPVEPAALSFGLGAIS